MGTIVEEWESHTSWHEWPVTTAAILIRFILDFSVLRSLSVRWSKMPQNSFSNYVPVHLCPLCILFLTRLTDQKSASKGNIYTAPQKVSEYTIQRARKKVRIYAILRVRGADHPSSKMEWRALHIAGGDSALITRELGCECNHLPGLSTLCTSVDLPKIWGKNSKRGRCRVSQGVQQSSWGGHWPLLIKRGVKSRKQHGALEHILKNCKDKRTHFG